MGLLSPAPGLSPLEWMPFKTQCALGWGGRAGVLAGLLSGEGGDKNPPSPPPLILVWLLQQLTASLQAVGLPQWLTAAFEGAGSIARSPFAVGARRLLLKTLYYPSLSL